MEELKTIPNEPKLSAPALAAKALEQELKPTSSPAASSLPVHDLTSMVKKKKKPIAEANSSHAVSETNGAASTKRKAEDASSGSPTDKRARVAEEEPPAAGTEA